MSFRIALILTCITAIVFLAAVSISAEDVAGKFTVDDKPIPVKFAYALLHDNAEGLLPTASQLRILVTDRQVPIESLYGVNFLPIADLGRRDEVRGILLQFDPVKNSDVDLTILMPNGRQTVTGAVHIKDFRLANKTVSGTFEFADADTFAGVSGHLPIVKFNFQLNAAVRGMPSVTADLKGRAAADSAPMKALRTIVDTITRGDFESLHKLSSESATRRNKEEIVRRGTGAKSFFIKTGAEMKKLLPGVKRVVVRGDRAVVILPEKTAFELVYEDGKWKGN